MPLPGGGYVMATHDFYAGTWVLQRYSADGQPSGAPTNLTVAPGQIGSIAPLTGGGYAAVWFNFRGCCGNAAAAESRSKP